MKFPASREKKHDRRASRPTFSPAAGREGGTPGLARRESPPRRWLNEEISHSRDGAGGGFHADVLRLFRCGQPRKGREGHGGSVGEGGADCYLGKRSSLGGKGDGRTEAGRGRDQKNW